VLGGGGGGGACAGYSRRQQLCTAMAVVPRRGRGRALTCSHTSLPFSSMFVIVVVTVRSGNKQKRAGGWGGGGVLCGQIPPLPEICKSFHNLLTYHVY